MAEKTSFNSVTRIISIIGVEPEIQVKRDIYSASKRYLRLANNSGIGQICRVIGGDITTGVFKAGDIYFLVNGWKLEIDPTVTQVTGSLFSDDFDTPLVNASGDPLFPHFVSNLVTGVAADMDVNVKLVNKQIITGDGGVGTEFQGA